MADAGGTVSWVVEAFIGPRTAQEVDEAIQMVADTLFDAPWGGDVVVSAREDRDDDAARSGRDG